MTEKNTNKQVKKRRRLFRTPIMGEPLPNGKRFLSMRMKFVGVMLVTGTAILLLALTAIPLSLQVFQKYHTRPERVEARLEGYVREFADYVAEKKIIPRLWWSGRAVTARCT